MSLTYQAERWPNTAVDGHSLPGRSAIVAVTVLVPTFNENANIRELVRQLAVAFDGWTAEVLFVDDSSDETPHTIRQVAFEYHNVIPIRLIHREGAARSGGLSGAVVDGLRAARGKYVVVMDGDLQHPPSLAPALVQAARDQDCGVVVASRYSGHGDAAGLGSAFRRRVSSGATLLARTLFPLRVGRRCTDPMTGYFCVRRRSIDPGRLRPRGFKVLLDILASHDVRVAEMPLQFCERLAGDSKASWQNGLQYLIQLATLRFPRGNFGLIVASTAVVLSAISLSVVVPRGLDILLGVLILALVAVWAVVACPLITSRAYLGRYYHNDRHGPSTRRRAAVPEPPTDIEKYAYLERAQHRWIFWVQAIAFVGVAISLYGMAQNAPWTVGFYVPLVLYGLEQAMALRTSTYRRRVTLPDHLFLVETYDPAAYPSVDLFLPTAGEPASLLRNTYEHVSCLDWPGELTTYVLDDAGRSEVARLANEYGFTYLARTGNSFKKAGNLQYGLERSTGGLIAILDADFVPRRDFLHELVPYMSEGKTGIVQSPQYFRTDLGLSWLERCAGATQEVFYRFIQPSRDAVGAAICVGTSAIYRREALDAIGGFPQIGHSEDVYTGVYMNRKGYATQYVPVLVSKGKSPDDLNAFISQQYRWAEGSLSLAADRAFHTEPSMSTKQRLSYWSGFLYYLTTAMNAILAPVAVLVMVWFFPERMSSLDVLPLLGGIVCWLLILPLVSFGRWRIDVLRVQVIYGFAHLFCFVDLIRGDPSEWVATNAALRSQPLGRRVRRAMAIYIVVSQLAVISGLIIGATRFGVEHYWANIILSLLSAYIFLPVAWVCVTRTRNDPAADVPEPSQARAAQHQLVSDQEIAAKSPFAEIR